MAWTWTQETPPTDFDSSSYSSFESHLDWPKFTLPNYELVTQPVTSSVCSSPSDSESFYHESQQDIEISLSEEDEKYSKQEYLDYDAEWEPEVEDDIAIYLRSLEKSEQLSISTTDSSADNYLGYETKEELELSTNEEISREISEQLDKSILLSSEDKLKYLNDFQLHENDFLDLIHINPVLEEQNTEIIPEEEKYNFDLKENLFLDGYPTPSPTEKSESEPDEKVSKLNTSKRIAENRKSPNDKILKPKRSYIHSDKKTHNCPQCSREFRAKASMHRHLFTHMDKSTKNELMKSWKYECNICNKKFRIPSQLEEHKSVHATIKTFQCHECLKFYRTKGDLHTHKYRHRKVSKCYFCQKALKTVDGLKKHLSCHTGEKYYRCSTSTCKMQFRTKSQLNIHVKAVHKKLKPHSCPVLPCQSRFVRTAHLRSHVKRVHNKIQTKSKPNAKVQWCVLPSN